MHANLKRVLVVEDNRVMADVLRFNLQRAGFGVTIAVNGQIATDLIRRTRFDFVITDHQMPVMSGAEFCRELRRDEKYAEVPILLCSAKGMELDTSRLKDELRIQEVVMKPFSPRMIVDIVQKALSDRPSGCLMTGSQQGQKPSTISGV